MTRTADSTVGQRSQPDGYLRGSVSSTTNGIAFVPTFSPGRPPTIFELSVGGKRLSFEPPLRCALDGTPWSFLFWWRYEVVTANRFRVRTGAHPALTFSATPRR
ncbi:hypothetical protein [Fibrella arboris]|uniref:hypothetical protein n=1 Tax=Fibrella arboris TaxID=3242486 RepID=UPI003522A561